jgi:4-hydroxy-tetrahydrodipicolinate synthase
LDPESKGGRDAAAAAMGIRTVLGSLPLMASVKAALGAITGDPGWERLMPPLRPLSTDECKQLLVKLDATGRFFTRQLARSSEAPAEGTLSRI